ncbi:hypothetical protein QFZ66_005139 [Streptomyces sp. B4I13]|nr:hypothetical protein [Streptomyces sp. B4I13]
MVPPMDGILLPHLHGGGPVPNQVITKSDETLAPGASPVRP